MRPMKWWSMVLSLCVLGIGWVSAAAGGTSVPAAPAKPVIGAPAGVPGQPEPGKRFTAAFKITRSDTRGRLTHGKVSCQVSVDGKAVAHTASFTGGVVHVLAVVPISAAGKLLTVRVAVTAAGQSAVRTASFRVQPLPKPELSVDDVTVAEGSSG